MKRKGPVTPNVAPNLASAGLDTTSKPVENAAAQAENFAPNISMDAFIEKHLQPWTKNNKDPAVTVKQSLKEYLSIQDENGNTILHRAIIMGRFDIAERLIKSGIDVLIPNNEGQTPLELSKKTNATALISLLESKVKSTTMSQTDSSRESSDRAASSEGKKTKQGRWAAFINSPVIKAIRSLNLNKILPKSRRGSSVSEKSEEFTASSRPASSVQTGSSPRSSTMASVNASGETLGNSAVQRASQAQVATDAKKMQQASDAMPAASRGRQSLAEPSEISDVSQSFVDTESPRDGNRSDAGDSKDPSADLSGEWFDEIEDKAAGEVQPPSSDANIAQIPTPTSPLPAPPSTPDAQPSDEQAAAQSSEEVEAGSRRASVESGAASSNVQDSSLQDLGVEEVSQNVRDLYEEHIGDLEEGLLDESELGAMSPEEEATFTAHVPPQSPASGKGRSVGVSTVGASTVGEDATEEDYDMLSPIMEDNKSDEEYVASMIEKYVEGGNLNTKNDLGETAQHKAVENGDLVVLKALLNKDADPNLRDNAGKTPLHVAVEKGNQEMVEVLLAEGAKPYIKDTLGKTPLDLAIENGDRGLINTLEEALKVSETAPTQQAPMPPQKVSASLAPNVDQSDTLPSREAPSVSKLEEDPANVAWREESLREINTQPDSKQTPLHVAVKESNKEKVEKLLDEIKSDVNAKDLEGNTALHVAVARGDLEMVKTLMARGADIEAKNNRKHSPLELAALVGLDEQGTVSNASLYGEIINELTSQNEPTNEQIDDDMAILKDLAKNVDMQQFETEFEKSEPVELATAGMRESEIEEQKAIQAELEAQRAASSDDPITSNNEYVDAIMEIIKTDANFDINELNLDDKTPLQVAVEVGNLRGVDILLAAGADPNRPLSDGSTVLRIAQQKGDASITDSLKLYGAELKAPTQTIAEEKNEAKLDVMSEQLSTESMQSVSSESQRNSDDLLDFISEDEAPILGPRQKGSDSISDEELENEIFSDEESDMGVVEARESVSDPLSDEELEKEIFETEMKDTGTVESSHTSDTAALSDLRNAVQEGDITKVKQLIAQGAHTQLENEEKNKVVDAAFEKMSNDPGNTDLSDLAFELQDLLSELPGDSKDVEERIEPIEAAQAESEAVEVAAETQERFSQDGSTQSEIQESVIKEVTGENVLHQAVRENDVGTLTKFLVEGLVVPGRKEQGKVIIQLDPNIQNSLGQTPLHLAAKEGQMALVDILLANGANPTIEDKEGNTAERVAINTLSDNPRDRVLDDISVKLGEASDSWQKRAGAEKLQGGAGDEKVTENLNKEAESQPVSQTVEEKVNDDAGKKENVAPLSRIQQMQQKRVDQGKAPLAPPKVPTSAKGAPLSDPQQNRVAPTSPHVEAMKRTHTEKKNDQVKNQPTGNVKPTR